MAGCAGGGGESEEIVVCMHLYCNTVSYSTNLVYSVAPIAPATAPPCQGRDHLFDDSDKATEP